MEFRTVSLKRAKIEIDKAVERTYKKAHKDGLFLGVALGLGGLMLFTVLAVLIMKALT